MAEDLVVHSVADLASFVRSACLLLLPINASELLDKVGFLDG